MSNTARYFDLTIPAPRRLALLRADFAKHSEKYPHCPEHAKPASWRNLRGTTHKGLSAYVGNLAQGSNGDTPIWYCHSGPFFNREYFADEFIGNHGRPLIEHTGWYADRDGSRTIRGLVVRLAHGRFLAGYYSKDNGERVYYQDVYDDERTAVYAADRHAERMAEDEREHDERYHAVRELEYESAEKLDRLRECLALRNNPCFARLRDEAADLIERIREIRETLKSDYADVL